MPMYLPDLGETHCISMRLCGTVHTKSKKTIELLHGSVGPLLAKYARNGRQTWVYVVLGSGRDEVRTTHFHIELLERLEYKPSASKLKPIDEDELQVAIEPMLGKRIDVSVAGYFTIPTRDVTKHSLAHTLVNAYREHKRKRTARLMVRSDYEITRGPIRNVRLQFSEDKREVLAELSSGYSGKIGKDYLQMFLGFLEFSFLLHVRGELPDVFDHRQV